MVRGHVEFDLPHGIGTGELDNLHIGDPIENQVVSESGNGRRRRLKGVHGSF